MYDPATLCKYYLEGKKTICEILIMLGEGSFDFLPGPKSFKPLNLLPLFGVLLDRFDTPVRLGHSGNGWSR